MSTPACSVTLSPSSLSTLLSCQKKYWHKKIAQTKPDADIEEDTEALRVGKAFHKVLEDCRHDLNGVGYSKVLATVWEHELDADVFTPMIYAMLSKYKIVHEKSGLRVKACEIEVRTEDFLGYVDVILEDESGWWVGDLKTASAYYSNIAAGLFRHTQLNLYAAHAKLLADALGLDVGKFRGCRYRMTTKSKLVRKKDETTEAYVGRLQKSVKSVDFILPVEDMAPAETLASHNAALRFIRNNQDGAAYMPNYSNCQQYFKSCEFFSQCHGKEYTKVEVASISADDE